MFRAPYRLLRSSAQPWRRALARRLRRTALLGGLLLGAVLLGSVGGLAEASAEPVLHEYIDLGPGRDPVEPVVTGQYPALPSAKTTGSSGSAPGGVSGAASRAGDPAAPGGSLSEAGISPGEPFSIDRDTSRATRVSYEDPFTPTLVPFKRGVVYDSVSRDGELIVRDSQLSVVPRAGVLQPSDEHFYATLELDLRPGVNVSIPSVAAGARLVMAHSNPDARLSFARDSAENWFVRSELSGHFEVSLQIAADRRVFGSAFADASWSEVGRELPVLPPIVKQSALEVARALGVAESARPRAAVLHLVEHFRRFRPSERRPSGVGLGLYREIALTARGICRHRAYAFMITALGLGIPTRLALNEAHAWVEVSDGEIWHRIDLGGAAEELEMSDGGRPQHVQPRDPFVWPDRSESGSALAERRLTAPDAARAPKGPAAGHALSGEGVPADALPSDAPTGDAVPGVAEPANGARAFAPTDEEDDGDPAVDAQRAAHAERAADAQRGPDPGVLPSDAPLVVSRVRFARGARSAERGKALYVSGLVTAGGQSCAGMGVQIELSDAHSSLWPLGTLISDAHGNFAGRLIVPWNAPLGDHTLRARARGACEH